MSHHTLPRGLYKPEFERDSCGFGLMANLENRPSHWLVKTSIQSLARLAHRGAVAPDGKTGDGCGLLFGMPHSFFQAITQESGISLSNHYAVGQLFLNPDPERSAQSLTILENEIQQEGFTIAGLREVPINSEVCGEQALQTLPRMMQIFINAPDTLEPDAFERRLFMARRRAEKILETQDYYFYICSFSSRTIIYKGMILPINLPVFYPDLTDPRFESALCVYHQRFSTNTWPEWRLAQPFRYLAHNGEINTKQPVRLAVNPRFLASAAAGHGAGF
jgi:glutamate synthase (NADPH) large chain